MTGADMSDGATRHAELMAQARRHLIRYLGGEFPDIFERAAGCVCVNPDVRSD